MEKIAREILINGYLVSDTTNAYSPKPSTQFEFVLNDKLKLLECIKIQTASTNNRFTVTEIPNHQEIYNFLFEINHIRVNPEYNNNAIIDLFIKKLSEIGINIHNPPDQKSMAICFKPLGMIKEKVRFYIKEDHSVIFLAINAKPKLIYKL